MSIIGGMAITVFGVVLLVAGLLFRERFKDVPYGQKSIGFGVGIGGKYGVAISGIIIIVLGLVICLI